MKLLITGASGYLGARLTRHLRRFRPDIELYLASRSGHCEWLTDLGGTQLPLTLQGDKSAIKLPVGLDAIIHLAALNEIDCGADVHSAIQINVQGTRQLIDAAVAAGVKHFVYASTIHVYGPLVGKLSEESLAHSHHPYGFTHHMAEQLMEFAVAKFGVSATCLRFANVIGAPANMAVNRWTLLVNDLCRQAVQTKRLVLKSPHSERDFVAMPDACAAFERAACSSQKPGTFEVYNISSGANLRVGAMAELIASCASKVMNCGIEIVSGSKAGNLQKTDDFQIVHAKALRWGWKPTGDLASEIEATLGLCLGRTDL